MIEDHYFFVLFSFVVMGAVSIFEWEMLFPDRLDFLVLTPLSLKPLQMLAAKAIALIGFLGLFLFACNFFGIWMLPAISRARLLPASIRTRSRSAVGGGICSFVFSGAGRSTALRARRRALSHGFARDSNVVRDGAGVADAALRELRRFNAGIVIGAAGDGTRFYLRFGFLACTSSCFMEMPHPHSRAR